jgi:hypothetical protein
MQAARQGEGGGGVAGLSGSSEADPRESISISLKLAGEGPVDLVPDLSVLEISSTE